jgi:hypothetical protein
MFWHNYCKKSDVIYCCYIEVIVSLVEAAKGFCHGAKNALLGSMTVAPGLKRAVEYNGKGVSHDFKTNL